MYYYKLTIGYYRAYLWVSGKESLCFGGIHFDCFSQ